MRKILSFTILFILIVAGGCKRNDSPSAPAAKPASNTPAQETQKQDQANLAARQATFEKLTHHLIKNITQIIKPGFESFTAELADCYNRSMRQPMTYIRAGDRTLAGDNAKQAVRYFTKAVQLDPKNPDALRGLAAAWVACGNHAQAADTCRKILDAYPHDEQARFNLGMSLLRTGKPSLAALEFEKLLTSPTYASRARFNLAGVLQSQGRLAEARDQLLLIIDASVTSEKQVITQAYWQLGSVYIDMQNYPAAMAAYTQVTKLEPFGCAGWVNLAEASRAAGNYGYAITAAQKAANLAPQNGDIQKRLGNIFLELHRYTNRAEFLDKAVDAWKKSVMLAPDQPELKKQLEIYSR